MARQFIAEGVRFNKAIETSTVQFQSFFGSAEEAEAHVKSLVQFAASTPFQIPGLQKASRMLLTFGADAVYGKDTLTILGDAAAGVSEPIEGVSMWVGRMYTALEGGKPIGEATARLQEMGLLSGPVRSRLEELAKAGGNVDEAMALLREEFSRHEGGMERLSQTTAGLESTFADLTSQVAGHIAEVSGISAAWKSGLQAANDYMTGILEGRYAEQRITVELDAAYRELTRLQKFAGEELLQTQIDKIQALVDERNALDQLNASTYNQLEAGDDMLTIIGRQVEAENELIRRKGELAGATDEVTKSYKRVSQVVDTTYIDSLERLNEEIKKIDETLGLSPPTDYYQDGVDAANEAARQIEQIESDKARAVREHLNKRQELEKENAEKVVKKAEETAAEWHDIWARAFQGFGGLMGALKESIFSQFSGMTEGVTKSLTGSFGPKIGGMLGGAFTGGLSAAIGIGLDFLSDKIDKWWKAEEKRINDISDSLIQSFSDIDSGALTAAEAMDKAMNWQGDEEGFERLRETKNLWADAGLAAEDGVIWMGKYQDAVKSGNEAAVLALIEERQQVGELARARQEAAEAEAAAQAEAQANAERTASSYVSAFQRAKEAASSAYDTVMEDAIAAGMTQEEAEQNAAAAAEAARNYELALAKWRFTQEASIDAALAEYKAGNIEGIAKAAHEGAKAAVAAWEAAAEAMGAVIGEMPDMPEFSLPTFSGAGSAGGGGAAPRDRTADLQRGLLGLPTIAAVQGLAELQAAFDAMDPATQSQAMAGYSEAMWDAAEAGHELTESQQEAADGWQAHIDGLEAAEIAAENTANAERELADAAKKAADDAAAAAEKAAEDARRAREKEVDAAYNAIDQISIAERERFAKAQAMEAALAAARAGGSRASVQAAARSALGRARTDYDTAADATQLARDVVNVVTHDAPTGVGASGGSGDVFLSDRKVGRVLTSSFPRSLSIMKVT